MKIQWQTESGRLTCRWQGAGERVRYDAPWLRGARAPEKSSGLPIPKFTRLSPFAGRGWYALALLVLAAVLAPGAEMDRCACDPARAATLEARDCSLCRVAESEPAGEPFFFLKDNSPLKPHQWLILPRTHASDGRTPMAKLSAAERAAFWTAAIERARTMFGPNWGLALNGDEARSQCHTHVHIGRLTEGVERGEPLVIDGPDKIPVPEDGAGMWIHAAGDKLHVHLGEQATEGVLEK
jgi:diadenosine tetraphosphate (Ap4A) HIT family hydrolase